MRLLKISLVVISLLGVVSPTPILAQGDNSDKPVTVVDAYGETIVIEDASRIITLGGSVTEIVFALGAGDQVIARDDSSLYPAAVQELDSVGYVRTVSAEPVLALNPTLIITTEDVGPPEAVDQLKTAGVTILVVPSEDSIDGVIRKIETVATALSRDEAGTQLIAKLETDYTEAQNLLAEVQSTPRVMFIYARGAGAVSVAGNDTSAAHMIELTGAENAVTEFDGYKPITAEAVVTAYPDVILMMSRGLESLGGVDGLLSQPGIAQTPAGENRRVVVVDDLYLLGFSTRTGSAILDLTYLLHEEIDPPLITLLRVDGHFETFLMALDAAALLEDTTPYTLFVPTDEAFAALPQGMLVGLMGSPISLQAVLAYHIIPSTVLVDDVREFAGGTIQTLYADGLLTVSIVDDAIVLNDSVMIVTSDLVASNGVIHIIDTVLVPERPA